MVLLHQASFLFTAGFMGDVKNRKPVIWFDITIASSESNAYSGNACIDPSFISQTQHLAEPIPGSATSELELLRDAFTLSLIHI